MICVNKNILWPDDVFNAAGPITGNVVEAEGQALGGEQGGLMDGNLPVHSALFCKQLCHFGNMTKYNVN